MLENETGVHSDEDDAAHHGGLYFQIAQPAALSVITGLGGLFLVRLENI